MFGHPFKSHRVSVILQAYEVNALSCFPELSQASPSLTLDSEMSVSGLLKSASQSIGIDDCLHELRGLTLKASLLLEPILDRLFKTLSRGERQRVMLACELMSRPTKPSLLLYKEPCTAMDAQFKSRTVELIKSLKEEGHAIVVTLQEPSLASRMGDDFYLVGSQGSVAEGDHSVLTATHLSQLFEVEVESIEPTEEGYPQFTVSGSSF